LDRIPRPAFAATFSNMFLHIEENPAAHKPDNTTAASCDYG